AYQQLNKADGNPLVNHAIQDRYAPGSTFKLVTAAAALASGKYNPQTQVPAPLQLTLPNTTATLSNFGGESCGGATVSLADALRVSCNTAFAQVGLDLGAAAIKAQADKFGFDDPSLTIPMAVAQSVMPAGLDAPETAQSAI
ncbi:penicillin-binding transpeptidase domain-containing protein, partial [Escherichia coli]